MARAVLIIADIGGYTRFMRVHRINLAHAHYVVAQLLEAIIDAAEPKLELAKLEGDAAFFYARLKDTPQPDELVPFEKTIADIRRAFLDRRDLLESERVCNCDACTQSGQLKLKFVAHSGEVAFQKIKRFTELAGVDVIFVHRLLKNNVPIPEYVLMSEPVWNGSTDDLKKFGKPANETLEGIGDVTTYYVDLTEALQSVPSRGRSGVFGRVLAWLKMTWSSIPYFLGIRKSCDGFRNLGDIDPNLVLPPESTARPERIQSLPPPSHSP